MKYKVGDKVKVIEFERLEKKFALGRAFSNGRLFTTKMQEFCGKVATIKAVLNSSYIIHEDGEQWYWDDNMLEPGNTQKIVITTDGTETLARLYDGGKVVKRATAKCSPDDTFDFNVGAKLAFERLMNEGKWRVVNRKPKVGDYIRIKNNDYSDVADVGDILKADDVSGTIVSIYNKNMPRPDKSAGDTFRWNYYFSEIEVVEPANSAVEEKPFKFEVGKQYIGSNSSGGELVIKITRRHNFGYTTLYDYEVVTGVDCGRRNFEENSIFGRKLKPYEPPKYYNGKVVCIESDIDLTVGKVYEFVDGKLIDDSGAERPCPYDPKTRVKNLYDGWASGKFIPFVE